jgi:hypothetical protein
MKGRQLLILGTVLVVLVIIGLVARFAGSKTTAVSGEDVLIEKFEPDKVAAMEFYHGANPAKKVLLKKKDSKWVVPSRYDAPADAKRIDEVLGDLQGLGGEIRARESSLFDQFEITQEQAVHLLLTAADGSKLVHLLIGKSGPDWGSTFARNAGANTVFIVDVPLLSRLGIDRPASGQLSGIDDMRWVDLTILPEFKWEDVTALDLRSPRTELSFERVESEKKEEKAEAKQGTPSWKVTTAGIDYTANDKGVKTLLQGLATRRADDIADPAKEDECGFEQAGYVATLTLDDKSSKRILVGREIEKEGRKQYYLRVEGDRLTYVVASYIVDRLFEHAGKLLVMKVLDIPESEVKSIALQAPETRIVIEREQGGKWRIAEPDLDFQEREGAAKRLADKLRMFEPDDLFNRGDNAFTQDAEYVMTLELKDGKSRTIELSSEVEGMNGDRYARVDGVGHVFGVSRNAFGQLCPGVARLLDVVLANLDRQHLRIMDVKREKQEFTLRKNPKEEWYVDAYDFSYRADETKVSDIRDSFTEIRPDDFVGKVDFTKYGLDKPVLTVKSKSRGEATVIVGDRDKSGKKYYAAEVESGIVFKMAEEDVKAAQVRLSQLATLRIFPQGMKPDSLALSVQGDQTRFSGKLEEREKDGKKVKIWMSKEGKELDAKLVHQLIMNIQSLMAADILDAELGIHEEFENYISVDIGEEDYYLILHHAFEDEKEEVRYCRLNKWVNREPRATILFLVREERLKPIYELVAKIEKSLETETPGKEPQDKGK